MAGLAVALLGAATLVTAGAGSAGAAAAAAPRAAASQHACTKTENGNDCIKGGEICPESKKGQTGYDAKGDAYVCEDKNGLRWVPASSSGGIKAQSVGRFLDGVVGGMPLESLVDVKDARATAPGKTSAQNPFDIKLFNQADIPLTDAVSIPSDPAVDAGAVNQVATAKEDGSSLGASGAVADDGGISAGDDNDGTPATASVNLTQAALPSDIPGLPDLPGAGDAASLGGVTASIGAVSAQAQTAVGGDVTPVPKYNIAGLNLKLASPALGNVLAMIGDALDTSGIPAPPDLGTGTLPGLPGLPSLPSGFELPSACTFQTQALSTISLEGGAITISPTSGAITISIDKLLDEFDINVNELPANTDLLAYVLSYITNPKLLAKSLENAFNDLVNPLKKNFTDCVTAINGVPGLGDALGSFFTAVTGGQDMIEDVIDMVIDPLADAAGTNPLAPLAAALKNVLDIGVNVQSGPGIEATQANDALKYTTGLQKTADQNTDVQSGQTLVRALEIDLLNVDPTQFGGVPAPGTSGAPSGVPTSGAPSTGVPTGVPTDVPTSIPSSDLPTLPGVGNFADRFDAAATAPNSMGVSLAFANASVGPTSESTTSASASPSGAARPGADAASTAIPIGVPAGQAGGDGSPVLPFVVLLLGLTVVGGGAFAYRKRGRFSHH